MQSDKEFWIWPSAIPFGAEDGSEGNEDNDTDSDKDDDKSKSQGKTGDSKDKSDSDEDDPYKGLTTKELKRLLKDIETSKSEAEQARKALQDKVDEEERKKRTKEENLEADIKSRDEKISSLLAVNSKLAIINAINAEKKYEWHDVEVVAQQLDSSIVKVDENGKVEGLIKDLSRVAKEHEYLLKAKTDSKNQQQQNHQVTGFQPGQGGASSDGDSADRNALANLMPALRSRM